MKYSFELAKASDAEEILNIYGPYIKNTAITFEYDVPSIEEFQDRIQTITSKYPWIVCRVNGEIAGYAYANQFRTRAAFNWAVESSIYISPNYHGRGIATMLYNKLMNLLSYQGFHHIYAFISMPNESSVALHNKLGFERIGLYENSGFKHGKWYSLLALNKQLKPSHEPTSIIPINTISSDKITELLSK